MFYNIRRMAIVKNKFYKILGIVLVVIGIMGLTGMREKESVKACSIKKESPVYHSEAGNVVSGSAVSNGAVYVKGWNKIEENKWVYANENGQLVDKPEGWYLIEKCYLYLDSKGKQIVKKKGWYQIKKKYYYLNGKGKIIPKNNGWYFIENKWYYIKKNIRVTKKAGWYKISGSWHYILKNGKYKSGWKNISGKKYYFNKKGKMTNGWFTVGKKTYYQTKKSGLRTLAVIKNPANGKYYYVDESGKKVDNKLTKLLVNVYRKTTNGGMSREKKLRAMYMYLAQSKNTNKNFTYQRRYDDRKYIGKAGWTADYAYQILSSGKGNCYRFACAFGYFAKMLGYDSYVRVGYCISRRGTYAPHAWVEIVTGNNSTLVYDPELQYALGRDLYQKTYQTNPLNLKKGKRYKIKF